MPRVSPRPVGPSRFTRRLALRAVVGLVVGGSAAVAAWGLDRLAGLTLPLASGTAQPLLAAFIGSVLTIAVFALWMRTVVVGLTSSEVSARVLSVYLDDRFQERVLGVMVGLFAYLVTAAALLPSDAQRIPAVTALLALVTVVAALIGILLAMRDAVSALSLPSVIRTLADGVLSLLERAPTPNDASADPRGEGLVPRHIVASRELGWVQAIDHTALLDELGPGGTLDLRVDVGDFVAGGEPLCRLDAAIDEEAADRVRDAFTLSRVRSTQRDLAYAIQQLVDIAETAMAPHSSDTSTAYEALVHLRAVLHALIRRGTASCCIEGDDGRWVVSSAAWSTVDHLEAVFGRLQAAAGDPISAWRVRQTIDALTATAEEVGDEASAAALRRLRGPEEGEA
ncbi:MAG TPA: DUF2254 family protein [Egicoccus sp.]|nr:DUF2254 family protein [Egicoccus sp.]HSK24791.1 DUF2254 family protein [Egicoccus sp.]